MSSEPQIRFFHSPTGHRVAYAVHGHGPPLLCTAWWVSHLEADWAHPGYRRFFEALGAHHTVIRYDRPGAGLSDREREVVDLESEVTTLGSLIDHLGHEKTSILGIACAGPPSLCYAGRNPEKVDRLVFFGSYARGRDVGKPEVRDALASLVLASWGMGSRALADLFAPNLDADARKALGDAQRKAATAEMSARLLALTFDAEVQLQAREVQTPALVLHRRRDRAIPFAAGRELAASLPNATLKSLEGEEHVPWFGDIDAASEAMLTFLGAKPEAAPTEPASPDRSMIREGDLWRMTFAGRSVHLPKARGLSDLAVLLARPGEEVHVSTLWSGAEVGHALGSTDDPMLDDEALAAYRTRLAELGEELTEAESFQQLGRAEKLRMEREFLASELRAAVGLGGRKRQNKDLSERARKAVSARIRSVLKKISTAHPELGSHLKTKIVTGSYCSYEGDPEEPWQLR